MTAGGGILHIETPPEDAGRERRPVPRRPAVGQPARASDKMTAPRYQDLGGRPGRAAVLARRRRARAAHRRRRRPATPAPASRTRRSSWPTPPWRPGARLDAALARRLQRPGLRAGRDGHGRRRAAAGRARPARRVRRRRHRSPSTPTPAARSRSRCCCSAASPIRRAGRRLRPVRDEHPGRAGPGLRGLPAPAGWARSPPTASAPTAPAGPRPPGAPATGRAPSTPAQPFMADDRQPSRPDRP